LFLCLCFLINWFFHWRDVPALKKKYRTYQFLVSLSLNLVFVFFAYDRLQDWLIEWLLYWLIHNLCSYALPPILFFLPKLTNLKARPSAQRQWVPAPTPENSHIDLHFLGEEKLQRNNTTTVFCFPVLWIFVCQCLYSGARGLCPPAEHHGECHLFLAGKLRGAFGQPAFFLAGNRMAGVAFEKEASLKSLRLFSKTTVRQYWSFKLAKKTCHICKWKGKVKKNTGGRQKV